ncbi:YcaO-like family protein [Spongiactinospora sp. TRM90649]|uniref:YcaO-like family protein n=1 Tax=Spongiactinospora sp. TRM90649 TaxID=3031114 RepID=UPI0023F77EFF|nr:YcaO-like family protein [Spongiactinospora sp. TRM90649]MDF5757267.1 YcaO-like family protein [Spongiactinospora sp. TRM90649]
MPLDEAGRRADAAVAALGLRAELRDAGGGRDPTAWWCALADGGVPVACGMGKGGPGEARVGAVFEAVEHYLTGPARFDPAAVERAPPARIAAGPLRAEACAPLLAATPGREMACLPYRSLDGGRTTLVPLFLFAPWYVEEGATGERERAGDDCDYSHLRRYSCNSGSAVGVTAAEALLHALNEAIERDALSLLLVRAFLGGRGPLPRPIDPRTLPPGPAAAYAAAAEVTGSPVWLLDITSDLGVPAMLAYTPPAGDRPHRRGAGTSLSPAHAAWRALTELVQVTLGESLIEGPASTRGDLGGLAAHPALHACGRFDLTAYLAGVPATPFPGEPAPPGSPAEQARKIAALLAARGRTVYRRTACALPGEVTAVHVIVPGLERFMVVTDGNLVLPGRRGMDAVNFTVRRHCRSAH